LSGWCPAALEAGLARADRVLETMTGVFFKTTSLSIRRLDLEQVPEVAGDATQDKVVVYVRLTGDTPGHACFLFEPRTAEFLADQLVGPGQTPELRESALSELCNVAGSAVLNSVADSGDIQLVPSPPLVVEDMGGAVLQSVAALLATQPQLTVWQAVVTIGGESGPAHLLILPESPVNSHREGPPAL